MSFEPLAGFPPLIPKEDVEVTEQTLESRGFATTNIVDIANIMEAKKKENLFIAFGSEEEDAIDYLVNNMLDNKPHEYDNVVYQNIPNLSKTLKR